LFRRLAREQRCAILIVTHDLRIRTTCDSVLHIRDGLLVPEDSLQLNATALNVTALT
jgi:putative ABC transport system ATP-binding protein